MLSQLLFAAFLIVAVSIDRKSDHVEPPRLRNIFAETRAMKGGAYPDRIGADEAQGSRFATGSEARSHG